jgi:hypothetical protein
MAYNQHEMDGAMRRRTDVGWSDQTIRSPLWYMDGARYGRIDARLTPDGGLEIRRHETGPSDLAVWGEDDHEATLRLGPQATARLALALIIERYAGRADALEALLELCEAHGVAASHSVWT